MLEGNNYNSHESGTEEMEIVKEENRLSIVKERFDKERSIANNIQQKGGDFFKDIESKQTEIWTSNIVHIPNYNQDEQGNFENNYLWDVDSDEVGLEEKAEMLNAMSIYMGKIIESSYNRGDFEFRFDKVEIRKTMIQFAGMIQQTRSSGIDVGEHIAKYNDFKKEIPGREVQFWMDRLVKKERFSQDHCIKNIEEELEIAHKMGTDLKDMIGISYSDLMYKINNDEPIQFKNYDDEVKEVYVPIQTKEKIEKAKENESKEETIG